MGLAMRVPRVDVFKVVLISLRGKIGDVRAKGEVKRYGNGHIAALDTSFGSSTGGVGPKF